MLKAFRFQKVNKKKPEKDDSEPESEPVQVQEKQRKPGDLVVLVQTSTETDPVSWYLISKERGLKHFQCPPLESSSEMTFEERCTLWDVTANHGNETKVLPNTYVFGRCPNATCIGIIKSYLEDGPEDAFYRNLKHTTEQEAMENVVAIYDEPYTYDM